MVLSRIRNGQRVDHFDTVRLTKDRRLIDVSITVSPVRDASGRIIGASKIARDISDRRRLDEERAAMLARERRAREEAEAASRVKDDFLATLSHELRTPLNAIVGWARMLQTGSLDVDTARHACEVIYRNAQAQTRLVEDLLDFGRINSGKMRLEIRPIYPIDFVKAAIDSVQPAATARRLRVETQLDPRAGPISGDPDRLQQVVWNLLVNAIKFTPEGGRLQVQLQRLSSDVEIVVSDTGQGIAAEVLPHIFEMFRQGDSGSARSSTGLGLGLALVRHLVHAHGGSVEAASPGPGQGAVFRVRLPVVVHPTLPTGRDERQAPSEAGALATTAITGVRVLVVEDDVDSLQLQTHLLMAHGGDVRGASSVAEAMAILKDWRPAVIVSDVEMPHEDGYTLVRRLREEVEGYIPAIALTAYSRTHDRVRAFTAGFSAHLTKPVEPAELLALIASFARL
jgi:signal transduction histidine kinase